MYITIGARIPVTFNEMQLRNCLDHPKSKMPPGGSVIALDNATNLALIRIGTDSIRVCEIEIMAELPSTHTKSNIKVNAGSVLDVHGAQFIIEGRIQGDPHVTFSVERWYKSEEDMMSVDVSEPMQFQNIDDAMYMDVMQLNLDMRYGDQGYAVMGVDASDSTVLLKHRDTYLEYNVAHNPINNTVDVVGLPIRTWNDA